jgi:hypothetical protein
MDQAHFDRKEIDEAVKEGRYVFWKVFVTLVITGVVLTVLGFVLHSAGVFGQTVVERKVFENSYQRSEAIKSQIATDEANLAEIDRKLQNPNLDPDTRANLEAQASAARVRIAAARSKQ